jgi:hypothetical protein
MATRNPQSPLKQQRLPKFWQDDDLLKLERVPYTAINHKLLSRFMLPRFGVLFRD